MDPDTIKLVLAIISALIGPVTVYVAMKTEITKLKAEFNMHINDPNLHQKKFEQIEEELREVNDKTQQNREMLIKLADLPDQISRMEKRLIALFKK